MIDKYKDFLVELDDILKDIFAHEKQYIRCKKGCSLCCESGEYPYSKIEFDYLMQGLNSLPIDVQKDIRKKFIELKKRKAESKEKNFGYKCPFLIENACCIYEYRGIICRTFGVAYYDKEKDRVHVPACIQYGLNYSEFYDKETKKYSLKYVPNVNLRTEKLLRCSLAKKYSI